MVLRTHFIKVAIISMSLVIIIFGAFANSYGATRYVDNAANGANNGNSWNDAWESFADINWSAVNPGDKIYISGGSTSKTYNERLSINDSGSSGNLITIDIGANSPFPARHDGQVRIDGQSSRSSCVDVSGNYVEVKNIYCEDATSEGVTAKNARGVIVDGMEFASIDGRGVKYNNCDNCVIRNIIYRTDANNSSQTDGIGIFKNGENGSDNVLVENNWLELTNQIGGHNDCIQFNRGRDATIRHNYCINTKVSSSDAQGIYATEMSGNLKIYGNVLYITDGGVAIANRNLSVGSAQSYIINNTVKCGGYRCIRVSEEDDPVIKNNIIWQENSSRYALVVDDWSGTASNINGNLYYNPGNKDVSRIKGSGRTWSEWTALGFDKNGLNTHPSLDEDFRPDNADSPSVGAGLRLASEYDDGLDSASHWWFPVRTVDRDTAGGSAWDIGAYEYTGSNSVAPPAASPNPPSNLRIIN